MAGIKNNRRTLYTKKVIREAFLALLENRELQKITVTDICKLADVNRGTFYQYYKDPADLFHQIEEELIDDILPIVKVRESEQLAEWLQRFITILQENQAISLSLLQNYTESRLINHIFAEVHEIAIAAFAYMYQQRDPRLLEYYFTYFVKGVIGTVVEWMEKDDGTTVAEISQILAQLLPPDPQR